MLDAEVDLNLSLKPPDMEDDDDAPGAIVFMSRTGEKQLYLGQLR